MPTVPDVEKSIVRKDCAKAMEKEKMNSHDIARLAGVSRSTVSRVINGYTNVSQETLERVNQVIREHNYFPQLSGQLLTGKKTDTIGFFWISDTATVTDPLCTAYFMHVINAAAAQGYLVLSSIVGELSNEENADFVRKTFLQGRIDAGIFIGINNNEPLLDELVGMGKIVGLFDYYHENEDIPNRITVNFERNSGEKCIDYVYGLGHRKIGIIDGNMSRFSLAQRHESYFRGMMKHHLPIQNKWIFFGGIDSAQAYAGAKKMLLACGNDLPTALCANNDIVAFGVYRACEELGVRIPEDLSVIGIDGHAGGATSSPPLTTISFDFERMFTSLVDRVVAAINQRSPVEQNDFIPGILVERQSCKRLLDS